MADAVDIVYDITKDEKLREEYLSYVENENNRIKQRIVSTIKTTS